MNRRSFVRLGYAFALADVQPHPGLLSPDALAANQATMRGGVRQPVLVRAGFTRPPDGKQEATNSQQTVVRSFDSDGRLAAFIVPVGEHNAYHGAPCMHITSRTSGFTSWPVNSSRKSAASACVLNLGTRF